MQSKVCDGALALARCGFWEITDDFIYSGEIMGIADDIASDAMSMANSLLPNGYPLPAFYFKVNFLATLGMLDTSFQEVSGISVEIETEDAPEGGNHYVRKLPKAIKHPNLVLKRGIAPMTSPLIIWCRAVMETNFMVPIVPMPLNVSLLNERNLPVRTWVFTDAYPVKWDVEPFNSTKNEVAIEKIELSYTYFTRLT